MQEGKLSVGPEPDLLGSASPAEPRPSHSADRAAADAAGFAPADLELFKASDRSDIPQSRWNQPDFKYAGECAHPLARSALTIRLYTG